MTVYSVVIMMIIIIIIHSKNLEFQYYSSDGLNITTEFYKQFSKLSLNIAVVLANFLQFWCLCRKAGDFLYVLNKVITFKLLFLK